MRSSFRFALTVSVVIFGALACAQDAARISHGLRPAPRDPVAEINGELLDEMSLSSKAHERLWRLDDTYAQERLVALWAGIEDAVSEKLLLSEARRLGKSVAELVQQEVTDKVGPTTDAEVKALYERHQASIGVPFEEAAPVLRQSARTEREKAVRRALVDRLREQAHVQLYLPSIGLHRKNMTGTGPSVGPKDAPITLVVFSDFACPYSAQARRLTRRLLDVYGDDLRVVHRNFPLPQHQGSEALALAGLCAEAQGKFWPFYEQAFEQDGSLESHRLDGIAKAADLDLAELTRCLADPAVKEALRHDIAQGREAGVSGTPSMFLNGMPLKGVLPWPVMQSLLEHERPPTRSAALSRGNR